MKHAWTVGLVGVLVLGGAAAVASAEPVDSFFDIWITGDNIVTESTGNGYVGPGGENIWRYPSGWWNQWFFNNPEIWDRWKQIDYHVTVEPAVEGSDALTVVINWSTPAWPDPFTPPLPDVIPGPEDEFIVRTAEIWNMPPVEQVVLDGTIIIPDYNPVWVSIDVRVDPLGGFAQYRVSGDIHHECLPEPATLSLLALGGVGALLRRRK
jgi:hypothetical protein